MKKLTVATAVAVLAGGVILGTGACGGGGGGPTEEPDALSGSYWWVGFLGRDATPDVGESQWGTFVSNGMGQAGLSLGWVNKNGLVTAEQPTGQDTYTIDANGRFALWLAGVEGAVGGIAPDGRAATLATTFMNFPPANVVLCRKGGTFTTASLDGLYHFVLFAYDFTGTNDISRWGTMTFSNGNITVDRMNNISGAVSSTLPLAANCFVAPDGQVDLTMDAETFRGGVLQGGELAALGGATANGGKPTMLVLAKGSTAATAATFEGTYHAVGIEAPVGGTPDWSSYATTADANGAGSLTLNAGQRNDDGVISALAPMTTTYTVAADGTLTLGGGDAIGGVSSTGRFALFGGSTVPAQGPFVWFLLK